MSQRKFCFIGSVLTVSNTDTSAKANRKVRSAQAVHAFKSGSAVAGSPHFKADPAVVVVRCPQRTFCFAPDCCAEDSAGYSARALLAATLRRYV